MKLPNASKAVVERTKLVDYLLNAAHPDNGGKAEFFEKLGFRRTAWKALADSRRVANLGREGGGGAEREIAAWGKVCDRRPD